MTDLIPAPRPVPTTEDRMRDARTDRTFATYLDATERDQLDARAATAEQERDDALDERDGLRAEINRVEQTRQEQVQALNAKFQDALWTAGQHATTAASLRQRLDQAQQRNSDLAHLLSRKRDTISALAAELGDAHDLIAEIRNNRANDDRAFARWETRQTGQQPPSSVPPRRAQEDDLTDRLAGALAEVMRSHTGADVSVASWDRWKALLVEHAEREG